jgi:hypothetical protein
MALRISQIANRYRTKTWVKPKESWLRLESPRRRGLACQAIGQIQPDVQGRRPGAWFVCWMEAPWGPGATN